MQKTLQKVNKRKHDLEKHLEEKNDYIERIRE